MMKVPTTIVIIVLFLSPVLLSYNISPVPAVNEDVNISSLQGWLGGWDVRKSHTIEGSIGAGNNYPVRLTVHYGFGTDSSADVYCDTNCRTDFGDIRFTDDEGLTPLDYWIESVVASDYAVFWVEIADNLDTNQDIYVYYGNPEATSISDGTATFQFFDDFESGTFDKWDIISGWEISATYQTEGVYGAYSEGGTSQPQLRHDMNQTESFLISIDARTFDNFNTFPYLVSSDAGSCYPCTFGWTNALYHTGSYSNWPQNSTLADNTWYAMQIGFDMNSGKVRGWKNGLYMGEVDFASTTGATPTYIRKWIPIEPNHGVWGIAEFELPDTDGWLNGWEFRKSHSIEGSLGAGFYYQVRVIVHYGSGIDVDENVYCNSMSKSNFDDIRFTDDDCTTELAHWRESYYDSDNATFWVRVHDTLNIAQNIYVYFGNVTADTASDGETTFLFFDDFNDDSFDANKWYETHNGGSYDESGGTLVISGGVTNWEAVGAKSKFGVDHAWSMRCLGSNDGTDSVGWGVDDRSDDGSYVGTGYTDAKFAYDSSMVYKSRHDGASQETARTTALTAYKHWSIHVHSSMTEYYEDGLLGANQSLVLPDTMGHMFTALYSNDITVDWVFTRNCIVTEPNHSGWGPLEIEFPVIDAPSDMIYEAGTTGHDIDWTPSDFTPASFSLYLDGVLQDSGAWDGSVITVSVDGLDPGTYNFTLQVADYFDNSATDTVFVLVEDTTVPILNHPVDITYNASDTGYVIEWSLSDLYPASYEVCRDNTLVTSGNWNTSGESVQLSVDGLAAGTYTYNLTAIDLSGNSAFDLVTVVVNPLPLFGPNNMVLILMIGGVAAVVIIGAVVCRSKKS
ncbi:MAG: DUF2341 domain-containing protein [Candidatus Thorarchaeota archaeon]|jgi:hypothetical protein